MADDSVWDSLKSVIRQGTGLIGSALKPSTWEKELGIPAAIPQALYAAGIGAGSLGDPNAIAGYWNEIEKSKQRKALKQLAVNLKVIKPEEELPAWVQSAQDLQPQYSQPTKQGIYKYPPGGGVPELLPGTAPPAGPEKLPTNETWTVAEKLYFDANKKYPESRADVMPYMGAAQEQVRQDKLNQAAAMTGQKPIHVPGVGFVTPGTTGGGPNVVPIPGEESKKKKVGQIANKKYVDSTGKPAPVDMTEEQAVQMGYRAVDMPAYRQFPALRQSMKILENISSTIDRLNKKGKLVEWKGDESRLDYQLDALGQVVGLKWRKLARDPDLRLAQAQTSQMISAMRNLGDKGVRAIQAFEGAMGLMEAGAAPYSTIRDFLQMLDSEMRETASEDVPQLLDRYPGARNLQPPAASDDELLQRHSQ